MIEEFLSHFQGVTQNGHQYMALCPAHDDRKASLSIKLAEDGNKILVHCFAGCTTEDILTKVGLSMNELYLEQRKSAPKQKINEQDYQYCDCDGTVLYYRKRIDYDDGTKTFYPFQPNGIKGLANVKRVVYNLPAVMKADTVYFVEGEKCAEAVIQAGKVATTLDSGANSKWLPEYNDYFNGKKVIVIPDNDEPGMKYAQRIVKNIPHAKIVKLPGLSAKEDIYDWLKNGHTMEELDGLPCEQNKKTVDGKPTQAETLLELVEENDIILFQNEVNAPYVALTVNGHTEVWSIEGQDFSVWLNKVYYEGTKRPIQKEAIKQAVAILSARARFNGNAPILLSSRIAKEDKSFWYDLSNPLWQAVKITADGWNIEDNVPILFNRYRHQMPQVNPQKTGGDVYKIFHHINMKDNQILFLCWLISSFIPEIPHAMLIFYGEKGAAKSTACGILNQLIDPSVLETLALPKNPRDLVVSLQQHWFLPFDNISNIGTDISDMLCRAITGGGIQQRKLCTNAEDYIFTFQRCISVNGIDNVAKRPDLLDRSLLIELRRIPESERKELGEIQENFKKDLPSILGGIFDVLSKAMRNFPDIHLTKLPRMADFTRWGYAIGEALGGHGEKFLKEYEANRAKQNIEVINSHLVSLMVTVFMQNKTIWEGWVSQLLAELVLLAPDLGINPHSKGFPSQPNLLSRRINETKSNLEAIGIVFTTDVRSQGTWIFIENKKASPLSPYRPISGGQLTEYHVPFNSEDLTSYQPENGKHGDDGDKFTDNK